VKDKLHYFGSLERFSIDRPKTINIPARPDLNATTATEDRVWIRSSAAIISSARTTPSSISPAPGAVAPAQSGHPAVGNAIGLRYRSPAASRSRPTCSISPIERNFGNPAGNLAATNFLLLTQYNTSYAPRKLQLGARLQF
jgi:hypothetical protein